MATHSSILARRIPRTEEPGGIQSMGSQRVRHDWVTNTFHRKDSYGFCGFCSEVRNSTATALASCSCQLPCEKALSSVWLIFPRQPLELYILLSCSPRNLADLQTFHTIDSYALKPAFSDLNPTVGRTQILLISYSQYSHWQSTPKATIQKSIPSAIPWDLMGTSPVVQVSRRAS